MAPRPNNTQSIECARPHLEEQCVRKSRPSDASLELAKEAIVPFADEDSISSPPNLGTSASSAFDSPTSVLHMPGPHREAHHHSWPLQPNTDYDEEICETLSPETFLHSGRGSPPSCPSPVESHSSGSSVSPTNAAALKLRLHPIIEKEDWEELEECLATLHESASAQDVDIVLGMQNEMGESLLHAAARKACPSDMFLSILELVPLDSREFYLFQKDLTGGTPLHSACEHANTDDFCIVKNLILLAPEALEMTNVHGNTPLHLLVTSPAFQASEDFALEAAAEEAISSLVEMAGHLATLPNEKGETLLHTAIIVGAHELVIMKLLELSPISAQLYDQLGNLPLHHSACSARTTGTVVQRLLELYPDSILRQNHNGDTPLHVLMIKGHKLVRKSHVNRSTAKMIELLLGAGQYDNAETVCCPLLIENNENLSPLHAAVLYDTPPAITRVVMTYLLSIHPTVWHQAVTLTTAFGATPLHLACAASSKRAKSRDGIAVIEAMATDEVCCLADSSGRTPLIVAVQNRKLSKRVVNVIVNASPKSVRLATESGHLPLHLAVQSKKARKKIVRILVKAFPASVYALTCVKDTALHEACAYRAPLDVVKYLVDKNDQALEERNEEGFTPIEVANRNRAPAKVIAYLDSSQRKREKLKEEIATKKRLGHC